MMSVKRIPQVFASIALCVAVPLSFAQAPGTSGPTNPKEVGKPGTPANSGTGTSGALNSSDAKRANAPADGASGGKNRLGNTKHKRAAKKSAGSASPP